MRSIKCHVNPLTILSAARVLIGYDLAKGQSAFNYPFVKIQVWAVGAMLHCDVGSAADQMVAGFARAGSAGIVCQSSKSAVYDKWLVIINWVQYVSSESLKSAGNLHSRPTLLPNYKVAAHD